MNPIVQRVAIAIWKAEYGQTRPPDYEPDPDTALALFEKAARAAIAAQNVPTREMWDAYERHSSSPGIVWWQAMNDAARRD